MFEVFREFRTLLGRIDVRTGAHRDALNGLAGAIRDLASAQREAGPAATRLEALELHRAHFEADIEGLLLRAEGKLKAAANAEARERQLKKSYEKNADPFDPDSPEGDVPEGVRLLDASPSEAERVQPVRMVVARNDKAAAVAAKWSS